MKKLAAAMAKAFPEIEGAAKDSENAAFKQGGRASKYADLSNVVDAIKPALAKHDLWFSQMTHEHDGGVCVETILTHSSGEQLSFGKLFVPASKQDAQGYGSALTYARRYSLMAAFGVAPEDDDGNVAAANPPARNGNASTRQSAPATINGDQLAKLQAEINRTDTASEAVCEGYKVKALAELNARQFTQAMDALRGRPDKPKPSGEFADAGLDDSIPF